MNAIVRAWIHWVLCGLAIVGAGVLAVLGYIRLNDAFEAGALTRETLIRALWDCGAVLGLLWAAGWAVATRPKPKTVVDPDAYLFA